MSKSLAHITGYVVGAFLSKSRRYIMTLASTSTPTEPAETIVVGGHTVVTQPSANEKTIAKALGTKAQPTVSTTTTAPKPSTDITKPSTTPPDSTGQAPKVTPFPKATTYSPNKQQPIQPVVDPLLLSILSWPRKHDSKSEHKFCKWLRETITQFGAQPEIGPLGCIITEVKYAPTGPDDTNPLSSTTLFSSHVDTIDPDGPAKGETMQTFKKKLAYDPNFGEIILDKDSVGGSLGADDGVGVWIMLKMIEAKIPGTYVFHRGEEVGGLGSAEIRDKKTAWLKKFEAAIAFDRAHNYEVITHQGGSECASDKFADALVLRLNAHGLSYQTSRAGVFTDTKNYRKAVAECVNLGVGYDGQHHRSESLDYSHAYALMEAALQVHWDSLPIDRDPAKPEPKWSYGGYTGGTGHNGYGGYTSGRGYGRGVDDLFDDEEDRHFNSKKPAGGSNVKKIAPPIPTSSGTLTTFDTLVGSTLEDLTAMLMHDPDAGAQSIAQLMLEIGRLRSDRNTLYDLAGLSDAI